MPPVVVQADPCVAAEAVSAFISISGPAEKVALFEKGLLANRALKKVGETTAGDVTLTVYQLAGNTPYRDIGGAIFEAQSLGLAIVVTPNAMPCEDHSN